MKYYVIFFLFIGHCIPKKIKAQKDLYWLFGTELGYLNNNYKFQQQGNVLQRGWNANGKGEFATFNLNSAAHYRFHRFFSIELGVQFREMDLMTSDQRFIKLNNVNANNANATFSGVATNEGFFDFAKWYFSPYVSGYFFFNNKNTSRIQPYLSVGLAPNYYMSSNTSLTGTYQYASTGEILKMTTNYSPFYISKFSEAGILFKSKLGIQIFLGAKYYIAGNMMSANYLNILNNSVQYSDRVIATGSYFSVSLKIGGRIFSSFRDKEIREEKKSVGQNIFGINYSETPVGGKL